MTLPTTLPTVDGGIFIFMYVPLNKLDNPYFSFQDRNFTFETSSPPTSYFLKKAAGIEKGASKPGNLSWFFIIDLQERHIY